MMIKVKTIYFAESVSPCMGKDFTGLDGGQSSGSPRTEADKYACWDNCMSDDNCRGASFLSDTLTANCVIHQSTITPQSNYKSDFFLKSCDQRMCFTLLIK